jgi:hypothetical protein
MEFLQWWNLIFILPFLGGIFYLFLMIAFGSSVLEQEVEVDLEGEVDIGEIITEPSFEVDTEPGEVFEALSFLGIGKIPISIIILTFCFLWGFLGWISNQIFRQILPSPGLFIWPSLGVAFLVSLIGTHWLATGLAKIMPRTETYAVSNQELVGKRAQALFNITEQFGRARLRDNSGNLIGVPCQVGPGEREIPSGSRVVLLRYDAKRKVFVVRPDPLEERGLTNIFPQHE